MCTQTGTGGKRHLHPVQESWQSAEKEHSLRRELRPTTRSQKLQDSWDLFCKLGQTNDFELSCSLKEEGGMGGSLVNALLELCLLSIKLEVKLVRASISKPSQTTPSLSLFHQTLCCPCLSAANS